MTFWMVVSPDSEPLGLTPEQFNAAVAERWPGQHQLLGEEPTMLSVAAIQPSDGTTPYEVSLPRSGTGLTMDGTWEQALEFAAWARAILAHFTKRLWLIDDGYSGHADVPAGASADQIAQGWIDHATHGEPTDVS